MEKVDRHQLLSHLKSMQDALLTSVSPEPPALASPLHFIPSLILCLPAAEGPAFLCNQGGLCLHLLHGHRPERRVCQRGREHDVTAHPSPAQLCKGQSLTHPLHACHYLEVKGHACHYLYWSRCWQFVAVNGSSFARSLSPTPCCYVCVHAVCVHAVCVHAVCVHVVCTCCMCAV